MAARFEVRAQVTTSLAVPATMEALERHRPSVGHAPGRRLDITITVDADNLAGAVATGIHLLERRLGPAVLIRATTADGKRVPVADIRQRAS